MQYLEILNQTVAKDVSALVITIVTTRRLHVLRRYLNKH